MGGTDTHMLRPALLLREEIINLLGIKSAASQSPSSQREKPPHSLPASSPVAFVLGDWCNTRASVWAPRPRGRMKRIHRSPRGTRGALLPPPNATVGGLQPQAQIGRAHV